jgi:hypothetical protein
MTHLDWIKAELGGLYGGEVVRELGELAQLYALYDGSAQDWAVSQGAGYAPTKLRANLIKKLIKEESRFMAGRAPELRIIADADCADSVRQIEKYLARVLDDNQWQKRLLHGVRDCFIAKRVALCLGGAPKEPLTVRFVPATEFVYEADEDGQIRKIIFFYGMNEGIDRGRQRIYRKKLWMQDGRCLMDEGVYDGYGRIVENRRSAADTGLAFMPAYVIVNDGLTGDPMGESDVRELADSQRAYNRLRSDDIDALKFNMFPQKVFVDASQASVESVVIAPGAMIDLATDPSRAGLGAASASVLESRFGYDARYEHAIERIRSDMHGLISVPDASIEQLKGFAASGKAMRAAYWGLICRCEEKWAEWDGALKWMVRSLIEMARIYTDARLPAIDYAVRVEHLYPIPDDEQSERASDLDEVRAGVRSRLSYIAKWQPDADAEGEIGRIEAEQRTLVAGVDG